jgi:hypothetical protein
MVVGGDEALTPFCCTNVSLPEVIVKIRRCIICCNYYDYFNYFAVCV